MIAYLNNTKTFRHPNLELNKIFGCPPKFERIAINVVFPAISVAIILRVQWGEDRDYTVTTNHT